MKFEIKKLKISRSLSEETLAFTCDLYVDGKRVGSADNHGTGGATNVHVFTMSADGKRVGTARDNMRARIATYATELLSALPPRTYDDMTLSYRHQEGDHAVKAGTKQIGDWIGDPVEDLVDHLVNELDAAQEAAKHEKKLAKHDAKAVAAYRAKGLGTIRVTRTTERAAETMWFPFDTDPKAAAAEAMLKMAHKQFPNATFAWKVVS